MSKEPQGAGRRSGRASPGRRRSRAAALAALLLLAPGAAGATTPAALPRQPSAAGPLGLGAVLAPGLLPTPGLPPRPAPALGGSWAPPAEAPPLAWAAAAAGARPHPSGLSWRSGASCSDAGFAAWRGRAMDVHVGFVEHDTWERMFRHFRGGYFRAFVRRTPQVVVSMPMMPRSARRQLAACGGGQFDATFRQFGALLVEAGAGGAIIRLGWEANIGSRSHPWGIDGTGDVADYKRCFQREAAALRSTAPGVTIEWTNAKRGALPISVLETYPGDAAVDLVGVHYYNNRPKIVTERDWAARYAATHNGGPWGLGGWLAAAKARGKRLAVGEWGQWTRGGESFAQADQPVYVDAMHRFFRANAGDIAYENYFNCRDQHRIYPTTGLPRSSDRYRQLWSSGRP